MFYEMIGFMAEGHGPELDCLPKFETSEAAFYLDFDGVLVDLAETPDGIDVPEKLSTLLNGLSEKSGGAIAIVSGRASADIRRHLPGYEGIVIGSHGGEIDRGDGKGPQPLVEVDEGKVAALQEMVHGFAASDPAYIAEAKPTGTVLHFRRKPELRSPAWSFLEHALGNFDGFHIHHSKMAFEVRPDGVGKEFAVARLSEEEPFKGRMPVVMGDDVTDEPMLEWSVKQNGVAVKVGEGQSVATCRLPSTKSARHALARQVAGEAPQPATEEA